MSLVPTKYVPLADSLLGRAAKLLELRYEYATVSELWHAAKQEDENLTFSTFVDALTLLFLMGAVDWRDGMLDWQVQP